MIVFEYPMQLFASTILLILWGHFSRKDLWVDLWRTLFFASFIFYGISMFWLPITIDNKFAMVFRDLCLMAGVAAFFQLFLRNQGLFIIGLIGLLGTMTWLKETNWFFPSHYNDALDPDGELLVELSEGVSPESVMAQLPQNKVTISRAFDPISPELTELDDYYVLDIKDNNIKSLELIKSALKKIEGVDWVEDNERIMLTPIEAQRQGTNTKFGVNDPGVSELWGFDAMKVDQLYNYLRENNIPIKKQAVIAIVDSGIDAKHEDLKDQYLSVGAKHDTDRHRHGTHCAGIAAAVSNNGVGVASLSPGTGYVKVTSLKAMSDMGLGSQKTVIAAMIEAADNQVDVISMSLGSRSNQFRQTAFIKAVKYANEKGAIVVAAAGNSNMNAKSFSPVNTPGVIGVSAIDPSISKAYFSNFVNEIPMAVAAPGVNIYSTIPNNQYEALNGTSMATPYVSGLIGLMRSIDPSINTTRAYEILHDTGMATKNNAATGPLIQPYAAIKYLVEN